MTRPRLFAFPYAGGSARVFRILAADGLSADVIAVEYPGHGRRMAEALEPCPEWVFATSEGTLLDRNNVAKGFKRGLRAAGLPHHSQFPTSRVRDPEPAPLRVER